MVVGGAAFMDNEQIKKKLIIREISFWKKNHLLPEHYCDFLMQLYTEGEALLEEQEEELSKQAVLKKDSAPIIKVVQMLMLALTTLAMIVLMFLFAQKYVIIPIALSCTIFIALVYYLLKTANSRTLTNTLIYATAALLLFAISIKVSTLLAPRHSLITLGVLLINCILWIIVGVQKKLIYFMISGILGIVLMLGYYFIFL